MVIETPVLLAYAIEDFTDIFRISGGFEHPKPPLSVRHWSEKHQIRIKFSLCDWHVCLALSQCHVLFYSTNGYASLSVCWSGTLIQGAVLDKRTAIGLILGTGSNACYMERANRVQHWEGQRHGEKQVTLILMIPIYIDLHLFHT